MPLKGQPTSLKDKPENKKLATYNYGVYLAFSVIFGVGLFLFIGSRIFYKTNQPPFEECWEGATGTDCRAT